MCRGLDTHKNLVTAKEGELNSVIPVAVGHQKDLDNIQNKLGSLQGQAPFPLSHQGL